MCALSGEVTIDLQALQLNYKKLDGLSASSCETAAAVKADAYGLGADLVVPALYEAGARRFFVATLDEGIRLRDVSPHASIYILNGFVSSARDIYRDHNFIPVLNSLSEIKLYSIFARELGEILPAILHFDTGMNRLGITEDDARVLFDDMSALDGIRLDYVMSHFSSSDDAQSSVNEYQYKRFQDISYHFKGVKQSLCNSGGVFQSRDYHLDLTRPGIAIYGGRAIVGSTNLMKPVVSLCAPILQIHSVKKDETAGYNATYHFKNNSHVAVVSIGYADGLLRSLSNKGALYWRGYRMPIRGRVSMDLVICDLDAVPEQEYPKIGDMAEVIGAHQTLDDLAKDAGTISYEILTSLGRRYRRLVL